MIEITKSNNIWKSNCINNAILSKLMQKIGWIQIVMTTNNSNLTGTLLLLKAIKFHHTLKYILVKY